MNKLVYLDLLILEISKTPMYEFWYNSQNQNMTKKQNHVT